MTTAAAHPLVRSRIVLAAMFCAGAFALIGVRLVDVMVFGANDGAAHAAIDRTNAVRADIVDRNGVLLARDLPSDDLYASPAAFWDTDEAARDLAMVLGVGEPRLVAAFAQRKGFIAVKRGLTPDEKDAVMRLGLPGLTFEPGYQRFYPEADPIARTIGRVDVDRHGISGLELGLDKMLRESSTPVRLSLDMRVQYVLSRYIAQAAETFQAKAAGGIILDVHTGEVLAIASLAKDDVGDPSALRDRMTQDVYELGSIFKTFAFAQAVEEKLIRLDENFNVGKPYRLGRHSIRDSHRLGPILSAAMVFAESSNIGTAQIAERFTPQTQRAFLTRLGLLDPVQTELAKVASPLTPSRWARTETATISFGHGVSVTPLAFAAAAASVVNGGTRLRPTFLRQTAAQNGDRVLTPEASATMRQLLRLVVTQGTGGKAEVPGYMVGGKTGTAEKPSGRGYAAHRLISSFCGVFPMDAPRYLVFVMFDEPKGTKATGGYATAGYVAAPATGEIIARIAPLLGVERRDAVVAAATP
jgi:cell division protein FtsI (penicillin-binding protein 3)